MKGKQKSGIFTSFFGLCICCLFQAVSAQDTYQKLDLQLDIEGIRSTEISPRKILQVITPAFPALAQGDIDLIETQRKESPGAFHVGFEQHFRGIPIFNASLRLNITQTGRIFSCLNQLKRIEAPQRFTFPETNLSLPLQHRGHKPRKIWFETQGELLPAYHLYPTQFSSHSHEIVLHALSHEMLYQETISAYYRPEQDTLGRGLVFNPNPCTKAEVEYGELFVDGNDARSTILDQLRDTVILRDLTFENGVFKLEGPYVKIVNIEPRNVQPVTSTNGDFFYTRDQAGFEEVMAYYHIDSFQRYVQSLGFTNLNGLPLRVDPHWEITFENSKFEPLEVDPFIQLGTFGVDDAEDADVIIHEYSHALSYYASGRTNSGSLERRGLDEGVADYFASRYSEDLSSYEFTQIFNWDGHNEFWPGRTTASAQKYPSIKNIFVYGEIWASTMMQIRADIGKEAADRILLQALYGFTRGMTLADGVALLLDADSLLYNASHSETIKFHFCQRGILMGSVCIAVGENPQVPKALFRLYPNPSSGSFRVEFEGINRPKIEVFDLVGKKMFETSDLQPPSTQLALKLPQGIYVVRLSGQNFQSATQKIYIQ